jgi:AcrR family transcriptional regulator
MAYAFPKDDGGITKEVLAQAPWQIQRAVMRTWFLERYENPEESTPYDSEEGGYVYIWGGPCDAWEELEAEFSGTVLDNVIQELARELTAEAPEWSRVPEYDTPDEYFVDAIQADVDPKKTATEGLAKIRSLLAVPTAPELELHMYWLLHVGAVTCLEAYLCDTFLNRILSDSQLKRRLVERSRDFIREKIPVATIYKYFDDLDKRLKEYLTETLWHNLPQAKWFYETVLEVEFPIMPTLAVAVMKRHDIVHRNGKTKDGDKVTLTRKDVEDLIQEVEAFVGTVEARLPKPPF